MPGILVTRPCLEDTASSGQMTDNRLQRGTPARGEHWTEENRRRREGPREKTMDWGGAVAGDIGGSARRLGVVFGN